MPRKSSENFNNYLPLILYFVRAALPFAELFLIGWIIYYVFNTDGISKEMTNILSACVGGLLVNYTKMSGFIFSKESDPSNSNYRG